MKYYELRLETDAPTIPNNRPIFYIYAENDPQAISMAQEEIKAHKDGRFGHKVFKAKLWKIADLVETNSFDEFLEKESD